MILIKQQVLDFFKLNDQLDYTVREISIRLGMHFQYVKAVITELEKEGVVIKVRTAVTYNNVNSYQLKEWLTPDIQKEIDRYSMNQLQL